MEKEQRIAQLQESIAQLKARMPRHSVPPAMIIELEEMEEELESLQGGTDRGWEPRFNV